MTHQEKQPSTAAHSLTLILRGLKLIGTFPKPVLLSHTVSALGNASVPFINIYFSAQILSELAGARNRDRLVTLTLLTIGLNLLMSLIKSALGRWKDYCDAVLWPSLNRVYSKKLLSMDYIDIENPDIQRQFSEINQHQYGMGFGLPQLVWMYDGIVTGFIQVVVSIAIAFSLFTLKVPAGSPLGYLDSPLAVALVGLILCISVLLAPYLMMVGGKVWAKMSEDNNKNNRLFTFYFYEMINGSEKAKDIRIYQQRNLINKGISWKESAKSWNEYAKYNARFSALSTGISFLSNGLIYLYVALKAVAGAFGVGGIVQYVGVITQFSSGFSQVLTHAGQLLNNVVFLEKALNFLDIPNEKYQGTLSVEKRDDNEYLIEFRHVSFKYAGAEEYALKDLNLSFPIGQRMAVVGMNGSGKTTMIKLLCRLYDPTEGVITLNGIDIKKYNYDEYMALFGVVFQDFKLLSFTLGQNVAAGVDYDREKVTQILTQTGFGERMRHLPHGADTWLYKNFEETGVEVSGGEAQKIALARALYKSAPFIVLDEPTAALDPVAEYEIYTKFNEIVDGKTAVYISHRLSSCRFCDDIAVFHEGRLIQQGCHDVLMTDKAGKYYELWNAQAQYYSQKQA